MTRFLTCVALSALLAAWCVAPSLAQAGQESKSETPPAAPSQGATVDGQPIVGLDATLKYVDAKITFDAQTQQYPIVYLRINGSEPLPFFLKLDSPQPVIVDAFAARALKLDGVKADVASKAGEF